MADEVRKIFTHLLVHDPQGPIPSATTRLRVACTPKSSMPESASHIPMDTVITCPLCRETDVYKELAEEMHPTPSADKAATVHVAKSGINWK